jgi:hypothetical protein
MERTQLRNKHNIRGGGQKSRSGGGGLKSRRSRTKPLRSGKQLHDGPEKPLRGFKRLPPDVVDIPKNNHTEKVTIGLLVASILIPVTLFVWWANHSPAMGLPDLVTLAILCLYTFLVISTISIIVQWGLGTLDLPERFMRWLGPATVGVIASLVLYVVNHAK